MKKLFAPIFWMARVIMWLVFWPLGLWRSIHHGNKKRTEELKKEIRAGGAKA